MIAADELAARHGLVRDAHDVVRDVALAEEVGHVEAEVDGRRAGVDERGERRGRRRDGRRVRRVEGGSKGSQPFSYQDTASPALNASTSPSPSTSNAKTETAFTASDVTTRSVKDLWIRSDGGGRKLRRLR